MKTYTDLLKIKNIHLTGIKGVAMTSIAQCLADMDKTITGSDVKEDFVTKALLDSLDIQVKIGFHESNISTQTELLIYTGAHGGSNNPEVKAARENNIPTLPHAEALGLLMQDKKGISICGVGGKSTTSAMITWIFETLHKKPSYSVGVGKIHGLERTGRFIPNSSFFIAEADEYATDPGVNNTPRFMFQHPQTIVCTNIAYDHPDIYASFEEMKDAFLTFFSSLPDGGHLIINGDDSNLLDIIQALNKSGQTGIHVVTVGENADSTFQITSFQSSKGETHTEFSFDGKSYELTLQIPGKFNAMNAVFAIAAAFQSGIAIEDAVYTLSSFSGTMRRFENMGKKNDIQFFDDYAHHPSEIQATLRALREWYPENRLHVLFQPHTFSRTKTLLEEFSRCFQDGDSIYLLDIFSSAREKEDVSISSDILAELLLKSGNEAECVHTINDALTRLRTVLQAGDVVITLGAGDVYQFHELW